MPRRKTHAEHVADILKANPNIEVIGKIINNETKVLCRCKVCHHEWDARPSNLKSGKGCPACAKIKNANAHRLTHAEHVAEIAAKNPNVEIIGKITSAKDKVLTRCRICDYKWNVAPYTLKNGHGCPKCAGRLTHAERVAVISEANPNVEILEEIKSVREKVLCRCKICGHEWKTKPSVLESGCGCPECKKVKIGNALRLTHAEQIAVIAKVNPDVEVLGEIKSNSVKVLCRCKICSYEWEARPNSLKKRVGCPKCAGVRVNKEEFINRAQAIHGDKYDYSLVEYVNNRKKVKIICPVHGVFEQTPTNHRHGQGCPRCANTGFLTHDVGKLYIMVDDLNVPTIMKIGVSVNEKDRSKAVLNSARRAGVTIPALHVAKTWEGPTELMIRIEQMMHENYAEWNIKFPAKFDGCTEFFQYTPDTAEAFDIIEETLHEIINGNKAA